MRFSLQGNVVDRANDRGIADLRIEAWDASGTCQSMLGYARSDEDGCFAMHIEEEDLRALLGPRVMTASFRVIQLPDQILLDTRGSLGWRLTNRLTEVTLRVAPGRPIARAQKLAPFVVRGAVFGDQGPIESHFVKAYDQGLTSQEELTRSIAVTDARGRYQLTYDPPTDFGKQCAELVIKVFRDSDCTDLVGESPVRCHALPTAVVDVTLKDQTWLGVSRYSRVDRALTAILGRTSLLAITTEEQREHLACSASVDRADLDAMIAAEHLCAAYPTLSRALTFALILRGFPGDEDGFFLHTKSVVSAELSAALDANLVPQTLRTEFTAVIEGWVQAAAAWSLKPRTGRAGLKELLDAAGIPSTDQASFAQQLLRNGDDMAAFWSTLSGPFDKPRIQLAFQWGAFTHGHIPLLMWWKDQYDNGEFQTLVEAAHRFTEDRWLGILDSGSPVIGAPADIPGVSDTERRRSFAKVIARTLAAAFPMDTFREQVASGEPAAIVSFFTTDHPTFDFAKDRLSNPTYAVTLAGMAPAERSRLKGMERLFRVAPRHGETQALLNAGYSSAHKIHERGRTKFVAQMESALGGAEAAETVFTKACYEVASAKVLFGKYGVANHVVQTRSVPNFLQPSVKEGDDNQIPDWKTLFGNAGGCACEHCKSVLGPAAYFVDLLHWLSGYDALEKLLDRRPDLVKIKLTCKSSHTTLPYLDLVNEALEVLVANEHLTPDPALTTPIETTYEAAELLAGPEIIHPKHHIGAWQAVAAAVHPFTLPRDLWAEEAGVYLGWLGTSREEIVRAFSKSTESTLAIEAARARLGVRNDTANAGWKLLLGTQSATTQVVWGNLSNYVTALAKVPTFIAMAGLKGFEELTELLDTRYANVPAALSLSPEDGCDIGAMTIAGLTATHLARIHRFIRLARLTDLSLGDLDPLVAAFSANGSAIELTGDLLSKVAAALSLAQRFGLTTPEIAAFYAPLDTHEQHLPTSAYRRLFLNKMVDAPDVDAFLKLLASVPTPDTYTQHRASLEQALAIASADLDLLFNADALKDKLNLPDSERVVDGAGAITLEGLSELYRVVRLARALRTSVPDFLVLRALLTSDPFLSPADTEAFLADIDDVRSQGLRPAEIQYALLAFATEASGLGVKAEELATVRAQVAMAVEAIHTETMVVEKLAAWAKIDVPVAAYLLQDVLRSPTDAELPATYDFLHPDDNQPERLNATLRLLRRHALLLRGTRIGGPVPPADPLSSAPDTPGELTAFGLYASGSPLRSLLAASTPTDLAQAKSHFASYLDVARHTALRDRLAGGPDALRTILEAGGDAASVRKVIGEQTGWHAPTVEHLASAHYGFDKVALREISNLRKLERGVKLVARVGLAAPELLAYLTLDPPIPSVPSTLADLTSIHMPPSARDLAVIARRAAKAKMSAEEWAKLARTLRDKVRDRVRRALIDWLVPRKYADISALFASLLLDPEMGDCLLSSRIVAAANTVQLFVQRCLLNLEPGCELDEDASNVWQWLKTYRLWEANRNVFLYPENYLEPELRDDKTPLYKRLETRLRQGEITDQAAEKAFEEYLLGLHEIAKLEVMAVETVRDDFDEKDKIYAYDEHVVARTRSKPNKWFYRRRLHEQRWTPWEKIELGIEAETIHLRWYNRRLYLFWPVFAQKPVKDQKGAPADSDEQVDSLEQYEIRIAWSAYEGGAWTPARHSTSEPLRLIPARSESTSVRGLTPLSVSIVPLPSAGPIFFSNGLRLLVVVQPVYTAVFTEFAHVKAGIFTFDACGGGRWKTTKYEEDLTDVMTVANPEPARWYLPNYPYDGFLEASHIRQNSGSKLKEFKIQRELFDVAGLSDMKLLGSHQGEWRVVTPVRSGKPYLAMDRFSFEDANHVLYARFRRTISITWGEGSLARPGMLAPLLSEHDKGAVRGEFEAWAEKAVTLFPQESIDERYRFELFEHPYVCEFTQRLAADGLPGLLGWKKDHLASVQFKAQDIDGIFEGYNPTSLVEKPFPKLEVDFSPGGAYSAYNWELFFHVPFATAKALHKEGRYAEAQRWLHFIFDPTTGTNGAAGPNRFWKVKPFHENTDLSTMQEDLEKLAFASSSAAEIQAIVAASEALQKNKDDLEIQIAESIADPFNPHAIARFRTLAYQKSVVLFYIDLLLDWGDSLFGIGSMETIHEALQLYLLAVDLLGPRPTFVKHKTEVGGLTYEELEADLDKFSNAAVDVEVIAPNAVPFGWSCSSTKPKIPDFRLYFCVPGNEKLLGLWDRVADRLFKLRNCLDLEGVARQIPLFQPPIDPALLVRARAAGVRFDQVLQALTAPAPMYRFVRLHAKAVEFAGAVLDLGRSLLGAIEKKDGEALAALRQGHDLALAEAEREVRKQAIRETKQTLEGLSRARRVTEKRYEHYRDIKYTIPEESTQFMYMKVAQGAHHLAGSAESLASGLAIIPDFDAGASGFCGSPVAKARFGGSNLSSAARAVAAGLSAIASNLDAEASMSELTASWKRRQEEWKLQAELAKRELAQMDKQIVAQEIRVAIAEAELQNLELRLEQGREVEAFLRRKFSNTDLYDWMVGELSAEHYQAYQLAFDMAKRAERAYQLERGDQGASFIRFGAWDSLKKGLLAGERLLQDLRAMDHAYLTRSERERELVKSIALSEINGAALRELRHDAADDAATSPHLEVEVSLPEALFDADYPGHYFRRIKSVAVTIPAVKPALDSVQCELVLIQSSVRVSSLLTNGEYARIVPPPNDPPDPRFHDDVTPKRHLATSAGELDSGLFEVNLHDDMLLPFEGAGVISTWALRVPQATNRFPLHLLSDVILHIRYTARDGGLALRQAALDEAKSKLTSRTRVFSLRRDFPTAWALFLRGNAAGTKNELEIALAQEHFLPFFGEPAATITGVMISGTFTPRARAEGSSGSVPMSLYKPGEPPAGGITATLSVGPGEPVAIDVDLNLPVELLRRDEAVSSPWKLVATPPTATALRGSNGLLAPDVFEDLWLTVTYTA